MRWLLAVSTIITIAAAIAIEDERPSNADLVEMPVTGPGYVDVRLDDERTSETSTSYLRRDLSALVRYAAAKVAREAHDWPTGHGGEIALGDMSERDGSTPGTRNGSPRHPAHTHVGGRDIDLAYFQRDTLDNQLRPICQHRQDGIEMYRCLAPPTRLDAWRTAFFIGAFLENAHVRVIGIDGYAAAPILAAFDELCATGWIEPSACARRSRITYETSDGGRGWFRGHHNHMHVSWSRN